MAKVSVFNTLIKTQLQSEKRTSQYFKLVFNLLGKCLRLNKVILVVGRNEAYQAMELTEDLEIKQLPVDLIFLEQNFESAFNFLKVRVTTSDSQQEIFSHFFPNAATEQLHAFPVYSEFKIKDEQRVQMIGFLISKGRTAQ